MTFEEWWASDFEDADTSEGVARQAWDAGRVSTAKAQDLIVRFGGIDGDHHKAWVLDQVMRVLAGDRYDAIVADACSDGYDWDVGIAP